MRRALVAVTTVAALAVGYGVADAYDRVPGVLTIDEAASEQPPEPVEPTPVLPPADESAPLPTAAGLRDAIADDVGSSALGPRVGIVVRDAVTGDPVWTKGADRPQTPASTAKLLTAAAVAEHTGVPTAAGRLDAGELPVTPDRLVDDGDGPVVGERPAVTVRGEAARRRGEQTESRTLSVDSRR